MSTFDRLGVHVEQCQSCKGIFLDYGELEQIVSAEQQYNASPPPLEYGGTQPAGAPQQGHPQQQGYRPDSPSPYRERSDSPSPFRGGYGSGYKDSPGPYGRGGGRKKKKSIFEQLFD